MRYNIIGNNDVDNILQTVLFNRGITDWKTYLSLNEAPRDTYKNLDYIDEAVQMFDKHFQAKNPIAILADNDYDGCTSCALMYKYIKDLDPDYDVRVYVHEKNKSHGLDGDFDIDNDIGLLIVPDAGSNDIEEHKRIVNELGIDCLCLDHHQVNINIEDSPAIIVNNQSSENYTNKHYCGAAITLEFCRALDEYYWEDISDNYLDLVATANVCDVMQLTSFETKASVVEGLSDIRNKMLLEIIKAQDFSMKGIVSPHTVGWYVGPLVNAHIRMASHEDRVLMMKAFCEEDNEIFMYTKRGTTEPIEENIYEHVVRMMKSSKGKQDRQRKKSVPELVEMAMNNDDKVAIIDATGIIDTGLTGVVAIKVSEEVNKPVLLLQQRDDDTYGGSGRVFDNCEVDNFRGLVAECPYVNMAQGHSGAFGISIDVDKVNLTRDWLNEQLADVKMDKVYDVDFEIDASALDYSIFQELDTCKTIWGHGVKEPLFAIKNIHISAETAKIIGSKQDTINIYNPETEVKYVKFFCNKNEELYQWIFNNWGDEEAYITIVGTLGLNSFQGRLDPQVNIKDVVITNTVQN